MSVVVSCRQFPALMDFGFIVCMTTFSKVRLFLHTSSSRPQAVDRRRFTEKVGPDDHHTMSYKTIS